MISCYLPEFSENWDEILEFVVFAYNISPQESTKETPFFLLYGRDPQTFLDVSYNAERAEGPGDDDGGVSVLRGLPARLALARDLAKERILKAQAKQKALYDRRANTRTYTVGDKVRLYDPRSYPQSKFSRRWRGEFVVDAIKRPRFLLSDPTHPEKAPRWWHEDYLKPTRGPSPPRLRLGGGGAECAGGRYSGSGESRK